MAAVVGSAPSTPYVPPQPGIGVDAAAPDTPAAVAQQVSSAPALPGGGSVSDAMLGALVAQQDAGNPAKAALDLKGRDLRATDLKTLDLRGADLSGANLSGVDLTGLDLSGAKLAAADLSGANLTNTNLTDVSAQGADFSQAKLQNTSLDGADFSNAKFDRAFIGRADDGQDQYGNPAYNFAKSVKVDGASFVGATMQRFQLKESSATGANFSNVTANSFGFMGSDASGANFDHVSGTYIAFSNSDLSGAAFTNSTNQRVGFSFTTIEGTKFAGSSFNQTSFTQTNLSAADLTGVVRDAKNAIFSGTNLDGVDFSNFDFSHALFDGDPRNLEGVDVRVVEGAGASFTGANFAGANFTATRFQGVDVSQAKSFANATFRNSNFQTGNPGTLANVAGLEFGDNVSAETFTALTGIVAVQGNGWIDDPSDTPEQRAAHSGSAGANDAASATQGRASSAKDQAAALALKTLTAINDKLRAAENAATARMPTRAPWRSPCCSRPRMRARRGPRLTRRNRRPSPSHNP